MDATTAWRGRPRVNRLLRPARMLMQIAFGLHSRIPFCCVLAFALNRSGDFVEGAYYRPCKRCSREIGEGVREPTEVESCDGRLSCRTLNRMGRFLASAYSPVCPFCNRRGFFAVEHVDEGRPPTPEDQVGCCAFCGRFGTITGEEIDVGPEMTADEYEAWLASDPEYAEVDFDRW